MPQITQSLVVQYPRPQVWAMLADAEQVVPCMPGASLTKPPEGSSIAGQMRVKLGPITAQFGGQGELVMDDATHTGVLRGQGNDAKSNSRAKGEAAFAVTEADGGAATTIALTVDYTLSGTLAQFSRGAIVQELVQRLTAEFARNLEARLAATAPATTPAPTAAAPEPALEAAAGPAAAIPAPAPAPAPAGELNAGALLWAMVKDWVKGLFAGRRAAP
ncbi:SRPBCC family protein [Azospirillum sp. RWY-5-1]|uniref:SRPBCC family protein n=1 Tax=Azospirillum oleiclasticum TaxID=2735135 RepID=A0ABX2T958_9PROT|nr:SRPBCC family protein [Azospirillum oleiclasticum]NYZ12632.1 SRPBCC family protein [Azospirillum oleiclasticum]NYZ19792.1 SRPBCC family protein [Azospirillum oleiclasticum]